MSASPVHAPDKVLNSWKELAEYLHRSVRTAQRWEAELGLPVRRPRGKSRSAVIAVCSEIDAWLKACPLHALDASASPDGAAVQGGSQPSAAPVSTSELIASSRQLRKEVAKSRREVNALLDALTGTIQKMNSRKETSGTLASRAIASSDPLD